MVEVDKGWSLIVYKLLTAVGDVRGWTKILQRDLVTWWWNDEVEDVYEESKIQGMEKAKGNSNMHMNITQLYKWHLRKT